MAKLVDIVAEDIWKSLQEKMKSKTGIEYDLITAVDACAELARAEGKHSKQDNDVSRVSVDSWRIRCGNLNIDYTESVPIAFWRDSYDDYHKYYSFERSMHIRLENKRQGYTLFAAFPYYIEVRERIAKEYGADIKHRGWIIDSMNIR
jgi:hypothetical protein